MFVRYHRFIATGFYSGLAPKAPGTFGSLAALSISLVLLKLGTISVFLMLVLAAFSTIHGLISIRHLYKNNMMHSDDPKEVVIDEFAGLFIACLALEYSISQLFLGFVLFRVFDIMKPWPICKLEKLPKEHGIMADDIGAGLAACILVNLALSLF